MIVLVANEAASGETRVAATPETAKKLIEAGLTVRVEAGAGAGAFLTDESYADAGAEVVQCTAEGRREADVLLKVGPLGALGESAESEVSTLKKGSVVVGFLDPYFHLDAVRELASGEVTSLPMEFVPRITQAQSMDALSSQASIAGYRAVLIAATRLPRYFPLLMTAAGTIRPAKVVVMGGC